MTSICLITENNPLFTLEAAYRLNPAYQTSILSWLRFDTRVYSSYELILVVSNNSYQNISNNLYKVIIFNLISAMSKRSQSETQKQGQLFPFEEDTIKQIYPQYSHQHLKNLLNDKVFDYSLGCVLGSCIGDALGSYCEFQTDISQNKMDQVMEMHGGGTFRTRPGQLTDDTELSMHLLNAILKAYDPKIILSEQINKIVLSTAGQYVQWKNSVPFDIGNTCSSAFNAIQSLGVNGYAQSQTVKDQDKSRSKVEDIMQKIMVDNSYSQSNGSLMRIAPMAVFLALRKHKMREVQIGPQQLKAEQFLIRRQIHLSHCNLAVVDSSVVWVDLLQKLILRTETINQLMKIHDQSLSNSPSSIQQWTLQAKKNQLVKGYPNIGWAKIAFCLGFNILRNLNQNTKRNQQAISLHHRMYTTNIRKVIQRGGDTDTNAAIVGGMLGAVVGFTHLPKIYLRKMMAIRFKQSPNYMQRKIFLERGKFYEPRRILVLAIKLYHKIQKL